MAWSRLQSNKVTVASGSPAVAYSSALSAGTKLICCVSQDVNVTGTITSVKDTAGNSFTQLAIATYPSTEGQLALYALDTPAGDVGTTPTITATLSSTFGCSILIQEVSGLLAGNTTAMLDGTPAPATGTVTPATSGAYSTSAVGEYLLAIVGDAGYTVSYSQTGFTADPNNPAPNSAADLQVGFGNSAGGAESMSWAYSGTAHWGTLLAAFQLAGGAPAPVAIASTLLVPPGRMSPAAWSRLVPPQPVIVIVNTGPVAVSTDDEGAAADTLDTQQAPSDIADAGGAADGLSVTVAVSASDAGAALDALAATESTALPDTGAGLDALAVTEGPVLIADAGGAVDSATITVPVSFTDASAEADGLSAAVAAALPDAGAAKDQLAVTETVALPDEGAAADSVNTSQPVNVADAGASADGLAASMTVAVADAGAALDTASAVQTVTVADAGAALDTVSALAQGQPFASDAGAALDSLAAQITGQNPFVTDAGAEADALGAVQAAALPDAGGASDQVRALQIVAVADAGAAGGTLTVIVPVGITDAGAVADSFTGGNANVMITVADSGAVAETITVARILPGSTGETGWEARLAATRWQAVPASARYRASLASLAWQAQPSASRWRARTAPARWRVLMAEFDTVWSGSLAEIPIIWTSDLAGTSVDPVAQNLAVQTAFKPSSGNPEAPTPPLVGDWKAASWLAGTTIKGFVSVCLVGPGGTITLTPGKWDVWGQITATPQVPAVFAGVLLVT